MAENKRFNTNLQMLKWEVKIVYGKITDIVYLILNVSKMTLCGNMRMFMIFSFV